MCKRILFKAETHYGTIEIQMTEKKALSYAKKLFKNHQKERDKFSGYRWEETPWGKRRTYCADADTIQPFLKVEFQEIINN